jgi:hypothetical protein
VSLYYSKICLQIGVFLFQARISGKPGPKLERENVQRVPRSCRQRRRRPTHRRIQLRVRANQKVGLAGLPRLGLHPVYQVLAFVYIRFIRCFPWSTSGLSGACFGQHPVYQVLALVYIRFIRSLSWATSGLSGACLGLHPVYQVRASVYIRFVGCLPWSTSGLSGACLVLRPV